MKTGACFIGMHSSCLCTRLSALASRISSSLQTGVLFHEQMNSIFIHALHGFVSATFSLGTGCWYEPQTLMDGSPACSTGCGCHCASALLKTAVALEADQSSLGLQTKALQMKRIALPA